jgi:hypothetical protein
MTGGGPSQVPDVRRLRDSERRTMGNIRALPKVTGRPVLRPLTPLRPDRRISPDWSRCVWRKRRRSPPGVRSASSAKLAHPAPPSLHGGGRDTESCRSDIDREPLDPSEPFDRDHGVRPAQPLALRPGSL